MRYLSFLFSFCLKPLCTSYKKQYHTKHHNRPIKQRVKGKRKRMRKEEMNERFYFDSQKT